MLLTESEEQSLKRCFQRLIPESDVHVSTSTWTSEWLGAPPNIEVLIKEDPKTFIESRFCYGAYEFKPFAGRSINCRIYLTSKKIHLTGCKDQDEVQRSLDLLSMACGGMTIRPPTCKLVNINICLPFSLNSQTVEIMKHTEGVRLVEYKEGHPALIIHICLGEGIYKKALLYPSSGKLSIHASNYDEALLMWSILSPPLLECRGIDRQN